MITVICLVLISVTFYCYHWKRKWLYVKNIQFRLSCAKLCQHLEGLELIVHNFIYMPSISFLNENLMVESGETLVVQLTVANDPRRMHTTSLVGERCGELGYSQAESTVLWSSWWIFHSLLHSDMRNGIMDFGFHVAFCDTVPMQNALAFYWSIRWVGTESQPA